MANLADSLSSIPFYGAYRARQSQMRDESADEMRQVAGAVSLADMLRKQGQEQQMRDVLTKTGGDPAKAIPLMVQSGNIQGAHTLSQLLENQGQDAERQQKVAAAQRAAQFYSPANQAQFATPGQAAGPAPDPQEIAQSEDYDTPMPTQRSAVAPSFDLERMVRAGASQGVINPEVALNHMTQRRQADAEREQRLFIAQQQIQRDIQIARERGADQRELRQMMINGNLQIAAMRNDNRPEQPLETVQDPTSPTGYRRVSRSEALNQPAPAPFSGNLGNYERSVSNDFEKHPVVKGYMDLQPDVDVVNNYMQRRPSVPSAQRATYDKNLVNTFMRVTHPKGDQISNFERKDLGALPALGPRFSKAIEGFFEGAFVPDDVAKEMAGIINEKFNARGAQVAEIENKTVEDVSRRGGNPDVIRRVTRGKANNVESAVKSAGWAYEPSKYEYRINESGQAQRRAK